jgi:hypothetical protein
MKKLLLIATLFIGFVSTAQNSFIVLKQNTTTTVSPNTLYDVATTPATLTTNTFDVKNTSSVTNVYNVTRYDLHLFRLTSIDTAEARFCFASQCYGAPILTGLFTLTLTPNQNTATMGDYYSLDCDLSEASIKGYSLVKYTIFNVNQPSDSIQFTIRYNDQLKNVGIKEQNSLTTDLQIVPNPANEATTISFTAKSSQASQLSVYNVIGQSVYQKTISITAGKNSFPIDMSNLPAGIYNVVIDNGTSTVTKKLTVTK